MGGHNPQQTQGMIEGAIIGGPIGAVIGNNPKMLGMKQDQFNQDLIGGAIAGPIGIGAAEYMRRNPQQQTAQSGGISQDDINKLRQMGYIQ
jgi:hypothetical protein